MDIDNMALTGYFASVLIGLSLGLLGGGGSILTVPLLVYFFNIEPALSTTYSLFIVGISSAAGAISYFRSKNIDLKIAILFGLPSLLAVFVMRRYVMPSIPYHLFNIGLWELNKPVLLMLAFSALMILASLTMIRKKHQVIAGQSDTCSCKKLIVQGLLIGIITGFVGVGGGFLIIPSLVLLAKTPMKKAVGTSLLIMAISSFSGISGDLLHNTKIDYNFITLFSAFAVSGIIAGSFLSKYIDESKLKPAFGWFVLSIGISILITEFI